MTDVFSKRKRSEVMSRIRGRGNKSTEVAFARLLRSKRITGWRRHIEVSLGDVGWKDSLTTQHQRTVRPDLVFRRQKVAVFIDGCFWHGCREHCAQPKQNAQFWSAKLESNKRRDRYVTRLLRHQGWKVFRLWEHEIDNPKRALSCLQQTLEAEKLEIRRDGKKSGFAAHHLPGYGRHAS